MGSGSFFLFIGRSIREQGDILCRAAPSVNEWWVRVSVSVNKSKIWFHTTPHTPHTTPPPAEEYLWTSSRKWRIKNSVTRELNKCKHGVLLLLYSFVLYYLLGRQHVSASNYSVFVSIHEFIIGRFWYFLICYIHTYSYYRISLTLPLYSIVSLSLYFVSRSSFNSWAV